MIMIIALISAIVTITYITNSIKNIKKTLSELFYLCL